MQEKRQRGELENKMKMKRNNLFQGWWKFGKGEEESLDES